MNRSRQTTLILGAGASCGYGYPTGAQLSQQILDLSDMPDLHQHLQLHPKDIDRFFTEFKYSQATSIDSFLGRRPYEFGAVGKAAIALVLLTKESDAHLFSNQNADHWYKHLLSLITESDWGTLNLSWLSIVTFNYDRSLERFLCRTLMANYGKSEDEVVAKLGQMSIVHVYGWLGNPWKGPDYLAFELPGPSETIGSRVKQAAARLNVIPEGRVDSDTLVRARRLITAAERVCFLGFGFDAVNVSRLSEGSAFQAFGSLPRNISNGKKPIVATTKGMTVAEVRKAITGLALNIDEELVHWGFLSDDCTGLLRKTLILEYQAFDA